MRTKKKSGLVTPAGLLRLVSSAAMGVAMGLAFAMLVILIDPSGIATLIDHRGYHGLIMSVSTLVLSFGIGATLTGAVFIVMEDS